MNQRKIRGRQLKQKVLEFLKWDDVHKALDEIRRLPARRVVNPLFSFFCSPDPLIKWRSVNAAGAVVADLAENELESARVIMRRFMWNLNEESGGIGWGCPEAMGEVMARSEKLANEYGCILISFIQPGGNFLEHEMLQRGVIWGIGRLAHARPSLIEDCAAFLVPFTQAEDAYLRGLAVWAAGPLNASLTGPSLNRLVKDPSTLQLFRDGQLEQCSVSQLAKEALAYTRLSLAAHSSQYQK